MYRFFLFVFSSSRRRTTMIISSNVLAKHAKSNFARCSGTKLGNVRVTEDVRHKKEHGNEVVLRETRPEHTDWKWTLILDGWSMNSSYLHLDGIETMRSVPIKTGNWDASDWNERGLAMVDELETRSAQHCLIGGVEIGGTYRVGMLSLFEVDVTVVAIVVLDFGRWFTDGGLLSGRGRAVTAEPVTVFGRCGDRTELAVDEETREYLSGERVDIRMDGWGPSGGTL